MPRRRVGRYRKRLVRRRRKPLRHYRRRGKKLTSLTIRRPSVLPDKLFVHLRYQRVGLLFASGSALSKFILRGNSPYDPEFALGGHSALGFDQWAALYENYRVHYSKVRMTLSSISQACRITCTPSSTSDYPNSTVTASELPYTHMSTYSTSLTLRNYIKHGMYTKKVLGLKSISYDDDNASPVHGLPFNQWFWIFYISSYDGTTAMNAYVDVDIVYSVEFFNRVELTQSGTVNQPFGQTGLTGGIGETVGGDTGVGYFFGHTFPS